MRRCTNRGFTLIELLLVVVIVGVLAALAIPKFSNTKARATRAAGIADLRNLSTAQETFFSENNRYAAIADSASLRFSLSAANSALTIVQAGTPPGTTGWNASLTIQGGDSCGIFVGAAAPPSGMPSTTLPNTPACW
jgi:type IV pilus assembly protein PilA